MSRPALILVPLLVLTALACGGLQQQAGQGLQETIAERIVEASSGEKIDLDLENDKFTISGKDGSMTFKGEGSATVPKDIPVTLPSDAKITASMDATGIEGGTKSASTVMFESGKGAKELGTQWEKELTDKGYKVTKMDMSGTSGGDVVIVSGEKDDHVVSCSASTEKGKTNGSVTKAQK